MAARIVLQEIPILPPPIEQEPFVIGPEEAVADCCPQIFSLTPRAHIKYISNDESKENLVPAQLDKMHTKKYHWGKNDGSKAADLVESGDLVERMITPRKENECSDWRIGEPNTPMDFSKATVDDFGISSESFTNCVGKSPRSLHKHRRRSTIGVRGSPEMNFLIRQIALQRSNRKEKAEPLTNPFMSPRNSALKVKMSSFQNAFQAVEENEGTGFSEKEERNCDAAERKVPEVKNEEIQPVPSSARGQKRKVMFADSFSPPSKKTICRIQSAESECRPSSGQALRPVLKKTPSKFSICRDEPGDQRVSFLVPETSENEDNTFFKKPVNDSVKKKKKVTFGRELSPELFDKTLPPDTPLRRGSTPYRLTVSDPATTTAEEAAHQSPSLSLPQPDFDCKDEEDTFQPISLCFDTGSPSQDTTMLLSSPGNNDPVCRMKELEDVNWEDETSETLPENPSTASPALNAEITNGK
ncbi:cell division cycle-associated protein 2 [Pyxicephalus adspersus]|uniref:cell division cycle-associated protein 2 n=1 Tax=Pyxicephalus adspersus TaxID=30357 RepID=UPI003B5B096F